MIVHVFNSNVVSGPETLIIPALPKLGEKVTVVFLSEERGGDRALSAPAYARSFGLDTVEVKVRSRWDTSAMLELRRTLKRLNPRIVHSHEVKASTFVAAASAGRPPYRMIVTNHGVNTKRGAKIWLYERFFIRVIMRSFDRVLTVCSSDVKLLTERGVSKDKVFVHLNGVDRVKTPVEKRAEESKRIREAWNLAARGVAPDAIVLGVVARLSGEKRHSFVLQTLKALRAQRPELDVHVVAFGLGALEAELKAQTRELGLEDRMHWMGYRKTVGAEMAGFDVLLSLSAAEGLPINVLEAGWAATPVFATGVDGNHDLIPSAEFGKLVGSNESPEQVAQKLGQFLSDRNALAATGANLQTRIEKSFSGSAWINRLQEMYRI